MDRLVLTSVDAFGHFPPTLFRLFPLIARLPRLLAALLWLLTRRPMRRLPGVFGWLSKRPLTNDLMDDWFRPLHGDPGVLHDVAKFVASMSPRYTLDAAERLRTFPRPALMAWAKEDRFFPYSDGEKLAKLIPQGRIVPIHDSYTFTPIDQPDATAEAIVSFLRDTEQGHDAK